MVETWNGGVESFPPICKNLNILASIRNELDEKISVYVDSLRQVSDDKADL